jgi:uncharacterized protein
MVAAIALAAIELAAFAFPVRAVLVLPGAATGQESLPAFDGWVTDLAGFLTPEQEQALEAWMASYQAGSSNEIAVLTVPNLGGRALESFALEVGRAWGMGEKGKNNAALLLIAREERQIRIEVGRGLEGNLTDSIAGRIIRDVIRPRFREERYHDGIREGLAAMHAAAGGDYGAIPDEGGGSAFPFFLSLAMVLFILWVRHRNALSLDHPSPWIGAPVGRRWLGAPSGMGGAWRGGTSRGGFGGFGGGGGFSGGGASGRW